MLLVDSPTDDSVEIAISFLKECGEKLTELSSKGVNGIFDTLRYILHDNKVDKRVSCKRPASVFLLILRSIYTFRCMPSRFNT